MSFSKTAAVSTLAVAVNNGDGFKRSAAYAEEGQSSYLDGSRNINIKAALDIVAKEYDISSNPSDYIFEAIRGNTVNVPNDNSDGFHKHELLRFDHRLGKQVYRTYELKPHQINHRAENPKNARGFIVDAHYNDSRPPLNICPECGTKTSEIGNRDAETGIHCIKCGSVVKDEFVELLVAIDTEKDPTFARGVLSGVLKHGSMGCSCLRTRCNICGNVAYSRNQFCAHIRNKGKVYDDTENGFNPVAFTIKYSEFDAKKASLPKKVAKAFEWCEGVIYDEYSRVHDPADSTCEQYEILKASSRIEELQVTDKLKNESEILMLQAKISQLQRDADTKLAKVAQKAGDVVINIGKPEGGGPEDVQVQSNQPLDEGIPIEEMMPGDLGLTPAPDGEQLTPAAMGILPTGGGAAGASPGPAPLPPRGGSKQSLNINTSGKAGGPTMLKFAESYKDLSAEITSKGNIRVFDKEGTLFVVKPELDKQANTNNSAKQILAMVAEIGMGATIAKTSAIVGPRLAQVLEYAINDMTEKRDSEPGSILDDAATDTEDQRTDGKKTETATMTGSETDRKEEYDTKGIGDDVLSDWTPDVEDEKHVKDPSKLNVTDMDDSDTREKRPEFDLGQSALDGETHDHGGKLATKQAAGDKHCSKCGHENCGCGADMATGGGCKCSGSYNAKRHAARLETLYANRLEHKVAALEKEKEDFKKHYAERFIKAMKIVANRQAINLEHSPIKESMGIALCNSRHLGDGYDYNPMDVHTASILVEAAFNEPIVGDNQPAWEKFVDNLITRTAEVMNMGDEALMQTEADLKNLKVAAVAAQSSSTFESSRQDVSLRMQANRGNLQLSPSGMEPAVSNSGGKRDQIRKAVGTTRVAGLASSGTFN